ncbi:alkyl sulfatase dimerization domain-containing protein [Algirhabdus cladophorae]|uniref:alkyl sulfatase dimerization domain-containing protein n=1 Tax=Algirhabdus cladophorae TaxID=3377108 RepID=UPI003B845CA3
MPAHPDLVAQNAQFTKKIHHIAGPVYSAVGYAASNVHFLVGEAGIVLIDTTETTQAAENIFADFRKISDLPITTIIYTHSHRDHISGATVFAEGRDVEVIAADNFMSDLVDVDTTRPAPNAALMTRTKRHFGISLAPDERISVGVGPGDRPMKGMGAGYIEPTLRISQTTQMTREGFDLELAKAPGETPDHLVVWWAGERVLFSGDNFYHAFPNLYAIRGTPYRDFDAWADAMDQLMAYEPAVLAPGHTQPVLGQEAIKAALTDYRDAIRFVVSHTVEGMNAGLDPITIAADLKLPEGLRDKPYLQEFYGHVGYASQAYFAGTLGWFDGNPTSLGKLPAAREATKFIALTGGAAAVADAAKQALAEDDTQWALELADRLIAADSNASTGRAIKIQALHIMADRTVNAPTRNYYILAARELREQDS